MPTALIVSTHQLVQPHALAQGAVDIEEKPDVFTVAGFHLIDICLRNAKFLGIEERKPDPFDDVKPSLIAWRTTGPSGSFEIVSGRIM